MSDQRDHADPKNLIGKQLIAFRKKSGFSQRELALQLQLIGLDVDKNVITRIETGKRHVTDIEIKKLAQLFQVCYEDLIDGNH